FVLLGHLNLLGGRFIQSRMDLQLQGKRALVTGSTAGIGLAIARGLAREGAGVIINGRTAQRVDQSVAALNKAGVSGKVEGLAADLGTADGTRTAIERFPEVDILVNNLGIFEAKPFEDIPDADWLRFFDEPSEWRAPQPPLSPWHEKTYLGTHCFYLQRIGNPE